MRGCLSTDERPFLMIMAQPHKNTGDKETRFSFKKEERLSSKKTIERLFADGSSFLVYPFKVVYLQTPLNTGFPVQVAFSVGKRIFKSAVRRNAIKRKMREIYRLNKAGLYAGLENHQLAVFFIFVGKTQPGYAQCEVAMKKAFKRLLNDVSNMTGAENGAVQ